jgi:hypothetical protein
LKIECRRDCGWGSVGVRDPLEIGAGGGEGRSSASAGPCETGDGSLCRAVGACPCGPPEFGGEESSGFAIRSPPNDWERLKSPSMTPPGKVCVAMARPLVIVDYFISGGRIEMRSRCGVCARSENIGWDGRIWRQEGKRSTGDGSLLSSELTLLELSPAVNKVCLSACECQPLEGSPDWSSRPILRLQHHKQDLGIELPLAATTQQCMHRINILVPLGPSHDTQPLARVSRDSGSFSAA